MVSVLVFMVSLYNWRYQNSLSLSLSLYRLVMSGDGYFIPKGDRYGGAMEGSAQDEAWG